ncbi:MAG: ABC transporter permease [Armatimonadetes bacterium CG_4_10_14_0_8_um_filter_66_14]|nr:carbohydrate ABC transporter permease [Armatimonadota bacterium]OIO98312.1 MAG: ABC transporter permease [Armatimonadetes bacterium CG2_30_66_41]PIU90236.1 MAG: ABC transporter permease [Armatimonadetes bacterium CG06_land_8_20_14_3_00_66_21]PIX46021.1 MAG: ABC transporter permease [Armatimonadetes bacterium CG_4_8_14_3_um_filter_66_20]PIZ43146.1 MAG: ABC transporter permease [Armatimonadetes bacterium CG_4_10_14_0_8_um_filter_66_14]
MADASRPDRTRLWRGLLVGSLCLGAAASLAPFAWMLLASFMTRGETIRHVLVPEHLQWGNYLTAWREADFGHYLIVSVVIAALQVGGTLAFCTPAAYALARMDFRGRNVLFLGILATLMIPESVTMIPNFLAVSWVGDVGPIPWINNWPALTIPFMASAFSIFLLRQFFAGIPNDLWEAARLDGMGHLGFLLKIVVPLSRAPLMTVGMLALIGSWNSLAWPLLVTNTPAWRPLAVGLQQFVSEAGAEVHLQMAGAVIAIVPILLAYLLVQKEFTEGIVMSGLKG